MVVKALWVTSLEAASPQNQQLHKLHLLQLCRLHLLQLHRLRLLQLRQLRVLLLKKQHMQRLMCPSRFQLGFRAAEPITTTELMARTLATSLRTVLRPRSILLLVVTLPWTTCLVESEVDPGVL